ncbi:MAG: hypothetical protein QM736_26785 [Vicinamibacterales bacterium]
MAGEQIELGRVVGKPGGYFFSIQFVMPVAADAERSAHILEEPAKVPPLAAQRDHASPRIEIGGPLLDQRDAVVSTVVADVAADITVLAGPREADASKTTAGERIRHLTVWCAVVASAATAATDMQGEVTISHGQLAATAASFAADPRFQRHGSRGTSHGLCWNVVGDDVHQTAYGVGAIEERGRPTHHFDTARRAGVDVHTVIARLAGEVAHALAVLEDQDAIAVQSPDDGTRRSGPLAARGNSRFVLQRLAECSLPLLLELLPREHRRGLYDSNWLRAEGLTDMTSL